MSIKNISIKNKLIIGFSLILAIIVTMGLMSYTKSSHYAELANITEFMIAKEVDHFKWTGAIKDLFINNDEELNVQTDHHKCGLGEWYYAFIDSEDFKTLPVDLQGKLLAIEKPHQHLHETAIKIGETYHQRHPGLEQTLYQRLNDHHLWASDVAKAIMSGETVRVQTDPAKCAFGKWLSSNEVEELSDKWPEFKLLIEELKPDHDAIHASVIDINNASSAARKNSIYLTETLSNLSQLEEHFSQLIALEVSNQRAYDNAEQIMRLETEPALVEVLAVFTEALDGLDHEAAAASNTMTATIVIGLLVSFGLALFLVWFLIQNTVKPIQNVVNMIKDIAQGEGDLTKRLEVDSKDELGILSKWFNTFVEKIQNIIIQVKDSADQVSSAAAEISASSEEMASGAEEQQSQTSEVATSIEEMAATILESSKNSSSATKSANQAVEVAREGGDVVESAVSGMNQISDSVRASSDRIEELGERSEEIGKIIAVIDDIADQTNLLALNANIEAARAGDQGRGFAVVADEVRVLAERTTKATAEIADMINNIQSGTKMAVEAMSQGIDQVDNGVNLVGQSGESLEKIIGVVSSVQQSINQLAVSAEEQSSGAEQISANVEGISTVTKQSANAAQQVATAAAQLSSETEQLNALVNQFKI